MMRFAGAIPLHASSRSHATVVLVGNSIEAFRPFRMHLLQMLVERGHDVHALYPQSKFDAAAGTNRLNLPGVTEAHFPLSPFSKNLFADLVSLQHLRAYFRLVRPTHTLSFTIKPAMYGGLAASAEGVPKIFSLITGLGYLFTSSAPHRMLMRGYAELVYRQALKRSERVFFQNGDDRNLFLERNLTDASKSQIVPGSGVDTDYFSPRPGAAQTPTFTFIGRLLRDKGISEFVEACRIVKTNYPNVRCVVVGPHSLNPSAVDMVLLERWVSEGVIEYRGHVEDVRPEIERSWAVVLPSYREGCSRVIQESLAMGRPVITSDAPGCRDSIEHGKQGLIVPVRNSVALAEAMSQIIDTPFLRNRMSILARKRAVELFDQVKITSALVEGMGL